MQVFILSQQNDVKSVLFLHVQVFILSQQNDVKSVLLSDIVVDCKLKIHGEGIMSHNFPCSPQGGKLSQ